MHDKRVNFPPNGTSALIISIALIIKSTQLLSKTGKPGFNLGSHAKTPCLVHHGFPAI